MKCLVCGREMLNRGTYLECPNILCDYEEESERRRRMCRQDGNKKYERRSSIILLDFLVESFGEMEVFLDDAPRGVLSRIDRSGIDKPCPGDQKTNG
jgi:hypothetical protein